MEFGQERAAVCRMAQRMYHAHLVRGTSGNVSMRVPASEYLAVTPSGMAYEALTPEDIVVIDLAGRVVAGTRRPSSESPMHRAIYRQRPDVHGVVHTHSIYATAFACLGEPMPVITTELAALVGGSVPVAPYAQAGTEAFAQVVVDTLQDGAACLLQSHGVLGVGASLEEAYAVAEGLEEAAQVLFIARQLGQPRALPAGESQRMYHAYRTVYGQPRA
jgi:L-fuculose-phosphate aldolase